MSSLLSAQLSSITTSALHLLQHQWLTGGVVVPHTQLWVCEQQQQVGEVSPLPNNVFPLHLSSTMFPFWKWLMFSVCQLPPLSEDQVSAVVFAAVTWGHNFLQTNPEMSEWIFLFLLSSNLSPALDFKTSPDSESVTSVSDTTKGHRGRRLRINVESSSDVVSTCWFIHKRLNVHNRVFSNIKKYDLKTCKNKSSLTSGFDDKCIFS